MRCVYVPSQTCVVDECALIVVYGRVMVVVEVLGKVLLVFWLPDGWVMEVMGVVMNGVLVFVSGVGKWRCCGV